ncbi:MAG: hypothetical protein HY075_08980 [Deltaproteobacteria bacterium]|nr:hypothetical protein [Deltaproteobacteria bacterium]
MKTQLGLIRLIVGVSALVSSASALGQQEAVTATYDKQNDWIVFEWFNPQTGKQQATLESFNSVNPVIHAQVSFDSASGAYTYTYQIGNLAGAKQILDDIDVKHPSAVFDAASPSPESDWYSTENQGQNSWSWSKVKGDVRGIPAGQTVSGFSFKSKGLPGIVNSTFAGKRRVKFKPPSPDRESIEVQQSFNRVYKATVAQYPDKFGTAVTRKTIGPIDPPAFNAASAIQNLITLVNQSKAQGWIDNDGIVTSLLAKLNTAQSKVGTDKATAKNTLNAFMNEVSAQNGKHLTSEAYALLYFNAQYAVNHL